MFIIFDFFGTFNKFDDYNSKVKTNMKVRKEEYVH